MKSTKAHAAALLLLTAPTAAAVASAPAAVSRLAITPQKHSVALVALGCPKNTVDAEVMLGDLQRSGLRIVREPEGADIVIVNTCAFVEDAKSESIAAVIEAADGTLPGLTPCPRPLATAHPAVDTLPRRCSLFSLRSACLSLCARACVCATGMLFRARAEREARRAK